MEYITGIGRITGQEEGKVLAEITWSEEGDRAVIDHTFVDDSLRGQGVASKLVGMAVSEIRQQGKRVDATCSYARRWLAEHGS